MKVHVYTVLRNEAPILPYFLRHYETIADRIYVMDDESDDGTLEILQRHPKVTVTPCVHHGIDDGSMMELFSHPWGDPDCDWNICVDADEFVYGWIPDNADAVLCEGYSMFSDSFPSTEGQIYDEVRYGLRDIWFDKAVIARPDSGIRYAPGRHQFELPEGKKYVVGPKLLHFRYLGKLYCEGRHARNVLRLTQRNIERGWGRHNIPGNMLAGCREWYEENKDKVVKIVGD